MRNLPGAIGAAIRHFWVVRGDQGQRQGERTGAKDTGNRALVTGGKQMTGFVDLHTAFREGAFQTNSRPWTGYLMLVEDHPKSRAPVKIKSPHFLPFPIFEAASYLNRYDIFCTRLVRERLYDSACLLTSTRDDGLNGVYREPNEELSLFNFAASLQGRIRTAVKRLQR